MSQVIVAATQMKCTPDRDENIANAEELVKKAAAKGAKIILLQELFETLYFCQTEKPEHFQLATELEKNPAVMHFSRLARELEVVLPISFFEKKNQAHYNTVAVIDADGCILGIYRKTHIPDGPGYEEKFYFNPGNTGFRVWKTRYANIGIGICWDQWFPEAARSMVLQGAEILFYPTAIGSEPVDPHEGFNGSLADLHARSCRCQFCSGRRLQPHRHRKQREFQRHLLRFIVYRRQHGTASGGSRPVC